MAEALYLNGTKINWNRPPRATTLVKWSKRTMYGKTVKGSLRTICHINRLNNLSKSKYGKEIVIIQPPYNTTIAASAGTHDYDCCVDLHIPGVGWWEQQRFFRANGLGCWYRYPPSFSNHIHGFTLPIPEGRVRRDDFATRVGVYVPGQLEDYYNHAFGLAGKHTPGSDRSWFPRNIDDTVFDLNAYIRKRQG